MKTLILTCGIPGSGKSTWAKDVVKAKHVSRDEVRFSMLSDKDEYFAKENDVFRTWIYQIQEALNSEDSDYNFVIADVTHLTEKSRYKTLINLKFNELMIFYFDIPLKVCLERNSKRTGRELVPKKVICDMFSKFEKPKETEYGSPKIIRMSELDHFDLPNI